MGRDRWMWLPAVVQFFDVCGCPVETLGGYRYLLRGARNGRPTLATGGVETIEERCKQRKSGVGERHVLLVL